MNLRKKKTISTQNEWRFLSKLLATFTFRTFSVYILLFSTLIVIVPIIEELIEFVEGNLAMFTRKSIQMEFSNNSCSALRLY